MFKFIKSLFKKKPIESSNSTGPVLVHVDIGESIVITEVVLEEVKPKIRKPKTPALREVKPIIDNVVPLVQPKIEKVTKPKKPAKPKKVVVVEETISLVPPANPKGRPKKTPNK